MNYKKIITAILLVSDGPVDHIYFEENFNISKTELLNIYTEINLDLKSDTLQSGQILLSRPPTPLPAHDPAPKAPKRKCAIGTS